MPSFLITLFFYIPMTLGFAVLVSERRDRRYLFRATFLAWAVLAPLTAWVNMWLPFTGGGDDNNYFALAATPLNNFNDLFDTTRFAGYIEQPGYPWLLSVLNFFSGPDLLAYKLLNLCFLILLALTWFRLAVLLESRELGRVVLISVLMLTPLWNYVFFLLKDMTITLLQSLFLLGLVSQWRNFKFRYWLLIAAATFALLPFRTALVLQNIAVIFLGLMLKLLNSKRQGRYIQILIMILAGILAIGILLVASNHEMMMNLGITDKSRILGSHEMIQSVVQDAEASQMNRALFPLLYLFSETAGLSPQLWGRFDAFWLRGALALPWIFLVVPYFLLGLRWLLKPEVIARTNSFANRLHRSRLMSTPWGLLLIFVLSMMAISWKVGDTTRWRIPDMPVIAAIAVAGWFFSTRSIRQQVLAFWVMTGGLLFSLFYLFKAF